MTKCCYVLNLLFALQVIQHFFDLVLQGRLLRHKEAEDLSDNGEDRASDCAIRAGSGEHARKHRDQTCAHIEERRGAAYEVAVFEGRGRSKRTLKELRHAIGYRFSNLLVILRSLSLCRRSLIFASDPVYRIFKLTSLNRIINVRESDLQKYVEVRIKLLFFKCRHD